MRTRSPVWFAWLLLVFVATPGCSSLLSGPGQTPSVATSGFRELWSVDFKSIGLELLPNRTQPPLAIARDVIVVTGTGGKTVGLDRVSGKVRWTVTLLPTPKDKIVDPPDDLSTRNEPKDGYDEVVASASGIVLLLTFNWTVAIDPATGQVLWATVGFWRSASPSYPDVFLTGTQHLNRVEPKSAMMMWSSSPPGYILGENDTTIVSLETLSGDRTTQRPTATAFDRDSGATRWQRADATPPPVEHGVAVDGDRAFILGNDGRVVALSTRDGSQLWANGDAVVPRPGATTEKSDPRLLGVGSGAVFVGVQAHGAAVLAIDGSTGALKWRQELPWERKPVGVVDISGVLATTPEYFVLLDSADGHLKASRGDLVGPAAMAGNMICAPIAAQSGSSSVTCMEAT